MSSIRLPLAFVASLVVATPIPAAAQFACTIPNDPACNHLKCYQIKDAPITVNVQVDNQFDREAFIQLTPVLLCTPAKKSCCIAGAGCSPNNCGPNPVPAPGLPHFKCYKFKGKTACTDLACTSTVKFPKGTVVKLSDQFGTETSVPVGKPLIFCTPALKEVISPTTTTTLCVPPNCPTTTTTTSSTTTTTILCHFDPASNGCAGPCPPTAPPGSLCRLVAAGKCDCVAPPVCCQCPAPAGTACFNTNGPCPAGCSTVPNASCNSSTGQCGCGFCLDLTTGTCSTIPCSTSQPCPSNQVCDPLHCPAPCDPCAQGTQCAPVLCARADGTSSRCMPSPPTGACSCCGLPGQPCIANNDCCSGMCDAASLTCK